MSSKHECLQRLFRFNLVIEAWLPVCIFSLALCGQIDRSLTLVSHLNIVCLTLCIIPLTTASKISSALSTSYSDEWSGPLGEAMWRNFAEQCNLPSLSLQLIEDSATSASRLQASGREPGPPLHACVGAWRREGPVCAYVTPRPVICSFCASFTLRLWGCSMQTKGGQTKIPPYSKYNLFVKFLFAKI